MEGLSQATDGTDGDAARSLFVTARGSPELFGDVYLAYRDQVLAFFARRVLDPEHAFDLMAETFADMFAGLAGFAGRTEGEGRAWMWTIARRKLVDWLRTGEVERRNLERLALPVPSLGPAEYERIEQLADLERFKPRLEEAMSKLPESQQIVLYEHFLKGRGYDEIAEQLGTPAVALRNRASRGLRQLSRLLDLEETEDETSQALT